MQKAGFPTTWLIYESAHLMCSTEASLNVNSTVYLYVIMFCEFFLGISSFIMTFVSRASKHDALHHIILTWDKVAGNMLTLPYIMLSEHGTHCTLNFKCTVLRIATCSIFLLV